MLKTADRIQTSTIVMTMGSQKLQDMMKLEYDRFMLLWLTQKLELLNVCQLCLSEDMRCSCPSTLNLTTKLGSFTKGLIHTRIKTNMK